MVRSGEIDPLSALDELELSVGICNSVNPFTAARTLAIVKQLRDDVLHIDLDFVDVVGDDIIIRTSEAQFEPLLAGLKAEGLLEKVKVVVEKE